MGCMRKTQWECQDNWFKFGDAITLLQHSNFENFERRDSTFFRQLGTEKKYINSTMVKLQNSQCSSIIHSDIWEAYQKIIFDITFSTHSTYFKHT